jgi:hypothetical protein
MVHILLRQERLFRPSVRKFHVRFEVLVAVTVKVDASATLKMEVAQSFEISVKPYEGSMLF